MPKNLHRIYGLGDLHFVTFSCYRRLPLLNTASRRDMVLRMLEQVRKKYDLVVLGYVVMPEHVHLLMSEPRIKNLSVALKALKQSVARRALRRSREGRSQGLLFGEGALLPHFWQARFYDFNVWSRKKRIEKLRYMHRNPVTRGLVSAPDQWRWSSFRYYYYGEPGLVAVNEDVPAGGKQ